MTKYPMKNQMIRELEDEIALNMRGCYCAPYHVKVSCRERVALLKWQISRIMKDKSIDVVPSTMYTKTWRINI